MIMSVYLHRSYVDILAQYGTLEEVINRILQEASEGNFSVEDKPPCGSREGAARYEVNVTNAEYLELLELYPTNSSKVSLRRLIYWFVDNDMMNECGWTPAYRYIASTHLKYVNQYSKTYCELAKLKKYAMDDGNVIVADRLDQLIKDFEDLREDKS